MAKSSTAIDPVSNGAKNSIDIEQPYAAHILLRGASPILFHRWNVEAVAGKAAAKKGSRQKKTDDIESYVYRNEESELCIPGENFRQSIITAAKFFQDPRSPRKSAMDLFKAGIVSLTDLCPLGAKDWDFLDQRRVTIQRAGITRTRPAMRAGWETSVTLQVLVPEYISQELLHEVVEKSGRLVGVCDMRPTYGRFQIMRFEVEQV